MIASRLFLTDILRKEYGFEGYVVSDSGAVEFVHSKHRVAATPSDGILTSVQAGLNIRTNFTRPEAYVEPLRELVKSGRLPMATVDARVRDILRVKYWLGQGAQPSDRIERFLAELGLAKKKTQFNDPQKSAPRKKAQERLAAEKKGEEAAA